MSDVRTDMFFRRTELSWLSVFYNVVGRRVPIVLVSTARLLCREGHEEHLVLLSNRHGSSESTILVAS